MMQDSCVVSTSPVCARVARTQSKIQIATLTSHPDVRSVAGSEGGRGRGGDSGTGENSEGSKGEHCS